MRRPSWWRPAHAEAAQFLTVVAAAGTLGAVLGALADRRLRNA